MFFNKLKEKLNDAVKLLSGRKDLLEAVCAAAALVASADGDISDAEVETATKVIANHAVLAKAYKPGDASKCLDTMLKRAQGGRSGRLGLYKEIEDVATASTEVREIVVACAVDIADVDHEIKDSETKALQEIAKRLGVNLNAILAV